VSSCRLDLLHQFANSAHLFSPAIDRAGEGGLAAGPIGHEGGCFAILVHQHLHLFEAQPLRHWRQSHAGHTLLFGQALTAHAVSLHGDGGVGDLRLGLVRWLGILADGAYDECRIGDRSGRG